jgi:hypothetical protein
MVSEQDVTVKEQSDLVRMPMYTHTFNSCSSTTTSPCRNSSSSCNNNIGSGRSDECSSKEAVAAAVNE